jgi:hypothetical protein
LVDKDALPEWLRRADQGGDAPASPSPSNPQAAARPATSDSSSLAPSPSSPFDGASLIDESSLPDWLRSRGETEPLPLPFTVSDSVRAGNIGAERGRKQSAAASDEGAADDEALPEWLQQVYADANVPPLYAEGASAGSGPPKLSGSDLLDKRSIPTWIQEATQTSPLPSIGDILSSPPLAAQPEARASLGFEQAPFSSASGGAAEPISGNSLIDEAHLPEWLRDLDDGGAPATAKDVFSPAFEGGADREGGASGAFSAAELVDTQALPTWLKDQGPQLGSEMTAGAMEPPDEPGGASEGFSAAELVDTYALPAWLKNQEPQRLSDQFPGPDQAGPSGGGSGLFSAAELVDTQALPTWLKDQEPTLGSGMASDSPGQDAPLGGASGAFSAAELVDTQALPTWLKAQEPGASQSPGASAAPSAPEMRPPSSKITPIPAGFSKQQTGEFSAIDLVDTGALPVWLKGAENAGAGVSGPGAPAGFGPDTGRPAFGGPSSSDPSSDQTGGFSAASLIDSDALPDWLRPAQSGALPPHPEMSAGGSEADWSRGDPDEGGFSAASLINPSDLPEWMRSQEGVQRPGSQPMEGGQEEGPQARVPRRPRLPTEPDRAPSQAAASVFSSVLGPTAGEDQRSQPQGRRPSREMPAVDRSGPLGQRSGPLQGQEWGGGEMGGWNQPPMSGYPNQPQSAFAGEQEWGGDQSGGPRAAGSWPGGFEGRGVAEAPREYREPGSGITGGREQAPSGGRGYGDYPGGPQGRGAPQNYGYRPEDEGWEGGPGYEQGYEDDEVGPPSGMFAKLKRMLGFGGS